MFWQPPRYQAGGPCWSKNTIRCKLPVFQQVHLGKKGCLSAFPILLLEVSPAIASAYPVSNGSPTVKTNSCSGNRKWYSSLFLAMDLISSWPNQNLKLLLK